MKIQLIRKHRKTDYTIGQLFINNQYFSDTLEDTDRGLKDSMSLEEIRRIKVFGDTCIPYGQYNITIDTVSPKFGSRPFYKEVCRGKVPRLLNVKGFNGILIHVGDGPNGYKLTEGCILIGKNTIKGGLTEGKKYFQLLYSQMLEASRKGEDIIINIIK